MESLKEAQLYEKICDIWSGNEILCTEDVDRYLYDFRILFAYHSTKIENPEISYYNTREIFESGMVSDFTGDPRTLFELQNQKMCYEFLKPLIVEKRPVSPEILLETHNLLLTSCYDERRYFVNEERPGTYKKKDYVVGLNEMGTSPEFVEEDVTELFKDINAIEYGDDFHRILKIAAYFHCQFECIHPFADGNGRVGRTLLNYLLMIHGHPPLIVYESDRKFYYAALEKFGEEEDVDSMVEFLKYCVEKTWRRLVEKKRVKSISEMKLF